MVNNILISRGTPVPLLYNDYGLEFELVVYNPSSSNSKSIQNKIKRKGD